MKQIALLAVLAIIVISACKKNTAPEVQGVNFNRLLKTVTRDVVFNTETTINYNYNNNRLAFSVLLINGGAGGSVPGKQTEVFYRNTDGRVDSALTIMDVNGIVNISAVHQFRYNGSGQLTASLYSSGPRRDSCLYLYAGNTLLRRTDYQSSNGAPFLPAVQADYSFDSRGNPARIIFNWLSGGPRTDTLLFTYDAGMNPLPVERFLSPYFTYSFANDFTSPHNPLTAGYAAGAYRNEYTYSSNNKPLYRKQTLLNSSPARVTETWYYYD